MRQVISGSTTARAAGMLLALAMAGPAGAQTDPTRAMDGEWHYMVAPYFWFTGLSGDASVKGLPPIPIDASFSDIISNFDIGLMGHFEMRKDRIGLGSDLLYVNLGAPVVGPLEGQLGLEVDMRMLIAEGYAFYRVAHGGAAANPSFVDVLAGVRYFGTSAQLEADALESGKRRLDWVDGMAGARFGLPLGSKVALLGRGDIAGFGSDFTWSVSGDLATRVSDRWTLGLGWRHMDADYDKGDGLNPSVLNVTLDGPRLWAAYAW